MKKPEIVLVDITEELKKKERKKRVRRVGDYIEIESDRQFSHYNIEINRIQTEKDLLKWIIQLIQKEWVDNDLIFELAILIHKEFDVEIFGL